MEFVVKFSPEITIKSKPVRKRFTQTLRNNLKILLERVEPNIVVQWGWDKIDIKSDSEDPEIRERLIDALSRVPGVANFLVVRDHPLGDMHDIYERTHAIYAPQLAGKTFVVRCKRAGKHEFTSNDVERYVGGGLNQHTEALGVKLKDPDMTVRLEIRDDRLYIVERRYEGLGGFPLGSLDPVLSLISGGFDSTVSTYYTMRRGMKTHFCFFNLGGRAHEVGVKQVALYLWMKYGSSQRVKFVSVPFEGVVSEILQEVENSQMGVILKRMMLRAASSVAEQLNVEALVTGESVAQVSSQTLVNLSVIDRVTDTLVLRPLITSDKLDIIRTAAEIGTEDFAKNIPEYCGVISVKPTTRAKPEKIAREEERFDFAVLEKAIEEAQVVNIDEVVADLRNVSLVDVVSTVAPGETVVDIRHPDEQERRPLVLEDNEVVTLPFYELAGRFGDLDAGKPYLLYCEKGVMSQLHAQHLSDEGHNVKVYRP